MLNTALLELSELSGTASTNDWAARWWRVLCVAASHTGGRTVLDEVRIPAYIHHASPRAVRLVRHIRVSPW